MAYEKPIFTQTFTAGEDLSAKQYHFVKLNAANSVHVCDATTDQILGVLQNAPASGEAANVMILGISKLTASAAIAAGANLSCDADGKGVTVTVGSDTTTYVGAVALEAASAEDEVISCLIGGAIAGRAA